MMAAVWLTVLLVHAGAPATTRPSGCFNYGIALAISILLDVYLALVVLWRTSYSSVSSGAPERFS